MYRIAVQAVLELGTKSVALMTALLAPEVAEVAEVVVVLDVTVQGSLEACFPYLHIHRHSLAGIVSPPPDSDEFAAAAAAAVAAPRPC